MPTYKKNGKMLQKTLDPYRPDLSLRNSATITYNNKTRKNNSNELSIDLVKYLITF